MTEETPQQADQGYPEEQPDEVAPESGHEPPKDREREGRREAAQRGDEDTATGNPRT